MTRVALYTLDSSEGVASHGGGIPGMSIERLPKEKIGKLEAARRQLCTAIKLFLEDGDIVSIHTLATASHEIFRALVKFKGGASMIKDNDFIKPEHQKEYEAFMNEPQNFFKHGARDAHKVLDFAPEGTAFWICDCIRMDRQLSAGSIPFIEFQAFMIWFIIQYPNLLTDEGAALLSDEMRDKLKKIRDSGSAKQSCLTLIKLPEFFSM
jgi:hypothetical protein